MLVGDTPRTYGVAPSMIHQVEVTQTVEIYADDASIADEKSVPSSRGEPADGYRSRNSFDSSGTQTPDIGLGRAI